MTGLLDQVNNINIGSGILIIYGWGGGENKEGDISKLRGTNFQCKP